MLAQAISGSGSTGPGRLPGSATDLPFSQVMSKDVISRAIIS